MAVLVAGMLLLGSLQSDQVEAAANAAGVDPADLAGALSTVGEPDPYEYLYHSGELRRPAPPVSLAIEARLHCIEHYESRGYALAYNRSSGASGRYQFLPSTWLTTPPGRRGASIWDPAAQHEAAAWMLSVGRAREWVPVQRGLC